MFYFRNETDCMRNNKLFWINKEVKLINKNTSLFYANSFYGTYNIPDVYVKMFSVCPMFGDAHFAQSQNQILLLYKKSTLCIDDGIHDACELFTCKSE